MVAGDAVHVVVVSKGKSAAIVRPECQAAHRVLGTAGVTFLDFPAARLDAVPGCEIADALGELVEHHRPNTVYLPHRGDIHADHQVVHLATLVACRPINQCSVRRMLCYETLSETEWSTPAGDQAFVPTVFVDISGTLATKLEAMRCYVSQLRPHPHPRSTEGLEALARLRGTVVGAQAAEAFALVREIIL